MSRHGGLLNKWNTWSLHGHSPRSACLAWSVILLLAGVAGRVEASDPPRRAAAPSGGVSTQVEMLSPKPTPLEEDAQLHDVHFVSDRIGWAVGDHGVIWHTRDGGTSWSLQPSGVNCSLNSVCFLSDRYGWAAGGGTSPFTRLSYGVLLHTEDGGATWQTLVASESKSRAIPSPTDSAPNDNNPNQVHPAASSTDSTKHITALPRLTRIKFFSQETGFAVGQGSEEQPSGVFFTDDGGASWRDMPGQASPGWLAADFLDEEVGVVAGPRGRMALVKGEQLASPRVENLGLRGLYDIVLQRPRSGWLVGDGGLALHTDSAGLVWEAPPRALPEGIRETCDFRAVGCRGRRVWLAGDPGSVIWHSPDAGKTWEKQSTEQTVPLTALHFASETCGCAVGALGTILRTTDGGQTWESVRGGQRRVALLFLQGSQSQVSLKPIVEHSGEWGYRSLISVVASSDLAAGARPETTELPVRLAEATVLAGGSAARVDWRLPLAIPGLERDAAKLAAEWKRRTEGRLEEILVGGIVRQLRTWRPSVLVLEKPAENDALTRFVNQAAIQAVEQAPDTTRFLEQQELAGLPPWQVEKVYLHLPPGSTGHVQIDPHRYLARQQETVHSAAAPGESLLFDRSGAPHQETYRLLRSRWDEKQSASIAASFFAGLAMSPGSDARRPLSPIDERDLADGQKRAQQQRNFAAVTDRSLDDRRKAGQLIAQLSESVRGLSDAQGALQLAELAERYHAHGQWELAELTMVELVEKYPGQPVAWRAMQQLVEYWASAEITWRRLKQSSNTHQRERSDLAQIPQAILHAEARLAQQAREEEKTIFDIEERPKSAIPLDSSPAKRNVATAGYVVHKQFEQKLRTWQAQAARMTRDLEHRAPQLAAAPEVQFPMAALYRQREMFARSDEIYRRFLQRETRGAWAWPAVAELWLNQPVAPLEGPVADCVRAPRRPMLDGVLSDDCWQEAVEIPLEGADKGSDRSLAMLCHDGEYLYLAASLPRIAGVRTDGPTDDPRRYDEDLSDFDRVTLCLDVDRDRVSYFRFSIDQRGCTSESCWHDRTWNPPGWVVAVDADDTHWRLEAAIPFAELTPRPPETGAAWSAAVVRTIPAVGWQSWTQPASETPRPETFGLVRFD